MFKADLHGVTFQSHNKKLLGGFYQAEGETPRPTAILLHGVPGIEKNLDIAYALREAGWNCLYFHYRGCWGSEGDYSFAGLADDVKAATDWVLKQETVDKTQLALVGSSMGGYTTFLAGARDERFKALVPICPLIDPHTAPFSQATFDEFATMLNGVSGLTLMTQYNALSPVTAMTGQLKDKPILLISGDQDVLFPPEHLQPAVDALPQIEWYRIPQGDHSFCTCRDELVNKVVSWLSAQMV